MGEHAVPLISGDSALFSDDISDIQFCRGCRTSLQDPCDFKDSMFELSLETDYMDVQQGGERKEEEIAKDENEKNDNDRSV